jgi:hypothetical protein
MAVQEKTFQRDSELQSNPDIERIYHQWDAALSRNDVSAILALYALDAELQGPLVSHLMNKEEGICRGHAELKQFFEILAQRKPKVRQFYRTGYFSDGRTVMWEYPHDTTASKWISLKSWRSRMG